MNARNKAFINTISEETFTEGDRKGRSVVTNNRSMPYVLVKIIEYEDNPCHATSMK